MVKSKQHNSTTDRVIQAIIFLIVGLWFSFTLLTTLFPQSIGYAEKQGKRAEAQSLRDYGNQFLSTRILKMAAGQYIEAIRLDPENNSAISNLASCYTQLQLFDKAIVTLNSLLKNNPERIHIPYYNLAQIYFRKTDLKKALHYFSLSNSTDPFPLKSELAMARIYIKTRKMGEGNSSSSKMR